MLKIKWNILIKWCLVNIKQGLDRVVMWKNNQAVGAPLQALLCIMYISSIVYTLDFIHYIVYNIVYIMYFNSFVQ